MHPILSASYEDNRDEMVRLLDGDVDLDTIRDDNGRTALMLAAQQGHCNMVFMLITKGASTTIKDHVVSTALILAIKGQHRLIVDLLVEIERVNYTLRRAAATGSVEVVSRCLELKGADINTRDSDRRTPLMLGAMGGHRDIVIKLMERRPDHDARDKNGHTALMLSAQYGHHEIAEFLAVAPAFSSALVSAAVAGYADIVELVMNKASVDDEEVCLAFMLSSYKGLDAVVQTLIDKGVDINMYARNCKTALHTACELGHLSVVKILVENGVTLDILTQEGDMTPLVLATIHGHREVVRYLINKGARVDIKDGTDKSAASYATDRYIHNMLVRARTELRRRNAEERRASRSIPLLPIGKAKTQAVDNAKAETLHETDMIQDKAVGNAKGVDNAKAETRHEADMIQDKAVDNAKAETRHEADIIQDKADDKADDKAETDINGDSDVKAGANGKSETDAKVKKGRLQKINQSCEAEDDIHEDDCPICFLQVSACDASSTPCSHPSCFHTDCLVRWKDTCRGKGREPTCPFCNGCI